MTKEEHLVIFGCRVRHLRTVLGLTVEELAARSRLSPSQVAAIERGDLALQRSTIQALIQALGCAPKVLLRASPISTRSLTLEDLAEDQASSPFESSSTQVQEAVLAILRSAAKRRHAPSSDPEGAQKNTAPSTQRK